MSAGGSSGSGGVPEASLRAAATHGDAAACRRLLNGRRGVRFPRDAAGQSALHLAAQAGHGDAVRVLLAAAAPHEIDAPDGDGCGALQRAAADGHEDVVKLLLARGADADKQDVVHGNGALHEASWKGYSRTLRLLAAAGANLDQPNGGGFTSLHLCCQNGHNQSCRELLLAGCDVDIKNNYGDTSLHTAARYGHAGVTRILLSAQCKVSEQNKNGDTALHIAAAMGRRKLTRILLEANCDKKIRNKQGETARDIAIRKDLREILKILDETSHFRRDKKSTRSKKPRGKSKVRFEAKDEDPSKSRHWSPYGCHYYPDPEAFPSPRLDSLPQEPLRKGEQYYLDLAGNIRKGPVGVGYTCYCAPLFRHLEARLEKDKRELMKAQLRLGQRVLGLEQELSRGCHVRRSERIPVREQQEQRLPRSRSLEMLDCVEKPIQCTRSMDELDNEDDDDGVETGCEPDRPSVRELVARIQQVQREENASKTHDNSESSDDEDGVKMPPKRGPMGDSNLENPRSRSCVYDPAAASGPSGKADGGKFLNLNGRFAKLRVLDAKNVENVKMFENSTLRMLENAHDNVDRDTNNDSGYSTKVYGSSKGNSPSLSGQLDSEIQRTSSLV